MSLPPTQLNLAYEVLRDPASRELYDSIHDKIAETWHRYREYKRNIAEKGRKQEEQRERKRQEEIRRRQLVEEARRKFDEERAKKNQDDLGSLAKRQIEADLRSAGMAEIYRQQ